MATFGSLIGSLFPSFRPPQAPESAHKPRKQRGLLITTFIRHRRNFFLVALALLFLAALKLWLPLPSSFATPPAEIPPNGMPVGFNLSEAQVDIRTKDLYESIEFKNIDGGAWSQGWDIRYKGDEWDKEILKVFVVPHSHNDPGWLRTFEQYYSETTRHILSTIVQSLAKDKRRKFIWEEISYLERWWRDASAVEKKEFTRLVKNGQLEIVSGGWVMNDEANSHYFAIVEQIIEGNIWLYDTVGVTPQNSWAIDPFGHSPTMAYLFRRMGFQNMVIQRTHYEVKKALALERNLEFLWRQIWDFHNTTDMFCHMMPFHAYDIPNTCGPDPVICCQFDYWRLGGADPCSSGENPQKVDINNVQEMSLKLLDQYRKKSMLYGTNTLLVPLGDDFRYTSVEEAELQYENYQKLFDHVNSHSELKAQLQFGTLADYFNTLQIRMKKSGFDRKGKRSVPTLSGDFFTYADRDEDYWSGYYVSRSFYKAMDRILEETLRAADILFSISLAYCSSSNQNDFPLSFSEKILSARRTLALFQHHDGITGTARDHVVMDYATGMHNSLVDLDIFMARSISVLLKNLTGVSCQAKDVDNAFEPAQARPSYDILPVTKAVDATFGKVHQVVFYNPLEEPIDQIAMMVVERTDICVMNSEWVSIESQLSPEWSYDNDNITTRRHRLHWQVSVPPMGFQSYFIANVDGSHSCEPAKLAQLKVFHVPATFTCPAPYVCSYPDEEIVEIKNQHYTFVFSVRHGLLLQIVTHKDGRKTLLEEEIAFYQSQGSGAYLFKPSGEASSLVISGGRMLVTEGPLMQEVFSQPKTIWNISPVTRSARLYGIEGSVQGSVAEMEYHTGLLDHSIYRNKEVITRFKTDINNGRVFFSDLNGFQMIRRETYDKIPLQGNYYPMPSLAFMQESGGRRLSLHTRQALGVASLNNGWMEVMLDRRLSYDDGRGLGQGVLDNHPVNTIFHLLLESNVTDLWDVNATTFSVPSLLSHRVEAQLNYPLHAFINTRELAYNERFANLATAFSPLGLKFPCDLHIVSLKVLRPRPESAHDFRYGMLLRRRGWDTTISGNKDTQCTTLTDCEMNLFNIFKHLKVTRAKASSLNMLHDNSEEFGSIQSLEERHGGEKTPQRAVLLDLPPMEIQAFKLDLQRRLD